MSRIMKLLSVSIRSFNDWVSLLQNVHFVVRWTVQIFSTLSSWRRGIIVLPRAYILISMRLVKQVKHCVLLSVFIVLQHSSVSQIRASAVLLLSCRWYAIWHTVRDMFWFDSCGANKSRVGQLAARFTLVMDVTSSSLSWCIFVEISTISIFCFCEIACFTHQIHQTSIYSCRGCSEDHISSIRLKIKMRRNAQIANFAFFAFLR